jgi:hypothetical protein
MVRIELKEIVNAVPPHAGRHGVFGSRPWQCRACRRVLGGEEEVVVFVENSVRWRVIKACH